MVLNTWINCETQVDFQQTSEDDRWFQIDNNHRFVNVSLITLENFILKLALICISKWFCNNWILLFFVKVEECMHQNEK